MVVTEYIIEYDEESDVKYNINMPENICGKSRKKNKFFVEKILRKLFFEIGKNPPSLKKSYSGYNKFIYFSTFLI